jgi:chaperonin GroES
MKLKPLNDRVIVKILEADEHTVGGIILPDTAKEKPQHAEVVAVGPGRMLDNGTRVPVAVKNSDRVLFAHYSGDKIELDGEEYLVLREDDILALL